VQWLRGGLVFEAHRLLYRSSIILEEQPVLRGAEEISLGMRTPEAKALIARFLALPQVSLSLSQSIFFFITLRPQSL